MRSPRIAVLSLLALVAAGLAVPRPVAAGNYMLTTLASFNGANGAAPIGGLVLDAQGNLYGTTAGGGANGSGTVFELAAGSSTITTLAPFSGINGSSVPFAGLVRDAQGNLYGTTTGFPYGPPGTIPGTVFELAAGSGTITTLASFNSASGYQSEFGLVRDAQGNLYGTTLAGGPGGFGTVFELKAGSSTITVLASGVFPTGGLVLDAQGNLYGVTNGPGFGTVFELKAGSSTLTTLASFNGANGAAPNGDLVRDAQGNLYGTTSGGGANGLGTVFELKAGSSTVTTLASFNGANGDTPLGGLVRDAQGNLFGTTSGNRYSGAGAVFELAADSSTITPVASFSSANGANLMAVLVLDAQGNLYGTTPGSGGPDLGMVFELSPVPEPASLVLLGTGLLGMLGAGCLCRKRGLTRCLTMFG